MSLYKFTSGVNTSFSTELNSNSSTSLRQLGRDLIRQLQDRSVDFSADGGEWAEAYVDSNGRKNSVDTSANTALYNSNTLVYGTGYNTYLADDTTDVTGSITNQSSFFDNNGSTSATSSTSSTGLTDSLGKTFSARYVDSVFISISIRLYGSAGTVSGSAKLQTYDGATWTDFLTLINVSDSTTYNYIDYISIGLSIQGIRVIMTTSTNTSVYHSHTYTIMNYGTPAESIITHNFPTGMLSNAINSSFGTTLIADWETGANIQYKLINDTEDSGWLDYNEVSTFTPFTSEPTKVIIKLVPKSSGATAGYPSIRGFSVFE